MTHLTLLTDGHEQLCKTKYRNQMCIETFIAVGQIDFIIVRSSKI